MAASRTWPVPAAVNRYLYMAAPGRNTSALVIQGDFPAGATCRRLGGPGIRARRPAGARDGGPYWRRRFGPDRAPGNGKVHVSPQWNDCIALRYDQEYVAHPTPVTNAVEVPGDWLTISGPHRAPAGSRGLRRCSGPGTSSGRCASSARPGCRRHSRRHGGRRAPRRTLWTSLVEPWGRFGATGPAFTWPSGAPHGRRTASSSPGWSTLENWKRAGTGWALWNLRGSFGVLDSVGRRDVWTISRPSARPPDAGPARQG